MKEFPKFSDAVILHQITQAEAKLLLASLRLLDAHLDSENPASDIQLVKSILEQSQDAYGFKYPAGHASNPRNIQPSLHQLLDKLCNAYTDVHEVHVRAATKALQDHYEENFEPDVFNLPHGETLRIAGYEYN